MAKEADRRPASAAEVQAALASIEPTPRPGPEPAALTERERRLLSLILVAPDEDPAPSRLQTEVHRSPEAPRGTVVETVASFGGSCEGLADGTVLALLPGRGTATDVALRAARCALALRRLLPRGRIALATGWAEVVGRRRIIAEVIDRAVAVLATGRAADQESPTVRVDDVTAGLLDASFKIGGDDAGLVLEGERDGTDPVGAARGQFVGRDRDLRHLLDLFRDVVDDATARAVLVTGPPGIGKSRLRTELVRRLASTHPDAQVWIARGDPVQSGSPFSLAAQILRRAANLIEADAPSVAWRKLRARVARHLSGGDVDRVAGFLADLTSLAEVDDRAPQVAAMRHDPMLVGDNKRRAWEDWVAAEASDGPLLIVIEDLHWGDLPSVKLLDSTLRRLRQSPVMVLATARTDIHEQFPHLWLDRGLLETRLGPLADRAAMQLARALLPGTVGEAVVARVLERAEGNPLFLEELCRAVRDNPETYAQATTSRLSTQGGHALPPSLLALVEARLEALEPWQRKVLRAASVFGQRFWRDGLVALLGNPTGVDGALTALRERDLVHSHGDEALGGGELMFRHSTVLEVAYASLTEADRVLGHRLAGHWLLTAGLDDAMTLAEHFDRGSERPAAVEWYLRAAEQSLEGDDLDAALERAARGVACGAAGVTLGRLRRVEAEAELWRGRYESAEVAAREAIGHLAPWSREWVEVQGVLAMAAGHLGRTFALARMADQLLGATPPSAVAGHAATVAARIATFLLLGGDTSVFALARRLVDWVGGADELPLLARAWIDTAEGIWAGHLGDVGARYARVERAARTFEEAGDLRNASYGQANLGSAAIEVGDYARAEEVLRRGLAMASDHGFHAVAAMMRQSLALALTRRSKLDEAAHAARIAIAALVAQRDRRSEAAARTTLAEIHLRAGQLVAAQTEVELALELSDDAPVRRASILALLADILLAAGLEHDALGHARLAMDILEHHGVDEGESHIRLTWARALAQVGRIRDARVALMAARRRLDDRAARISDPAVRASFLDHVIVNARTQAWEP